MVHKCRLDDGKPWIGSYDLRSLGPDDILFMSIVIGRRVFFEGLGRRFWMHAGRYWSRVYRFVEIGDGKCRASTSDIQRD